MRVLYLTNNGGFASTTVAVRGWFRHLIPQGLRPVIVTPIVGEFCEWAAGLGVPSYAVSLPFPDKRWPVPFLRSLWKICRIARRHRIELIHANEHDVYPIAQYAARLLDVPVVVTARFTLTRGFAQWAFRGSRRPDRVFFNTRGSYEASYDAIQPYVPDSTLRVIHNGLVLANYPFSQEARLIARRTLNCGESISIGIGCALRPVKQMEHLVEIGQRLAELNINVLLAGGPVPGFESYADQLLMMARQRLGERFRFLGWLKTPQLQELYNALDLCVNTSAEESFGLSVLESLACGCPVVGYPSVSVSEVVLPDGGQIVPQNDIDALATAVREWLTDRQRLAAARPLARRQAQRFDIAQISQELWKEYQDVLAEHRASRRSRCSLAGRG